MAKPLSGIRKNRKSGSTDHYVRIREKEIEEQIRQLNEQLYMEDPEPATCSRFGCGKTLTREESLFGDRCINCQGVGKIDIMMVAKFK